MAKIMEVNVSAEVTPGAQRQHWIRSSAARKCYWCNQSATTGAITEDSWFIAGDICKVVDDEELHVISRERLFSIFLISRAIHQSLWKCN